MLLRPLRSPALLPLLLAALLGSVPAAAQEPQPGTVDGNILFNFYGQDGEHSPVTGGAGTEQMTVVGFVLDARYQLSQSWSVDGEFGVDSITSASLDRIDLDELFVSSASRNDQRIYGHLGAQRRLGQHLLGAVAGVSAEYDYVSAQMGLSWSGDFNRRNTMVSARFNQFLDSLKLIGIHGSAGEDEDENTETATRNTSTAAASLSQVLGPSAVASLNLEYTHQWGFLSQPFQEVILAPAPGELEGLHVAEQLPDTRERRAAGLQLNVALTPRLVQRSFYRFYDDSWGVRAHTIESETHLRLPTRFEMWVFPILRFHTQQAADAYGPPGTFTEQDPYFTADDDLAGLHSEKLGLGLRVVRGHEPHTSFFSLFREMEWRAVYTTREDGLWSFSLSSGVHWEH